MSEAGGFLIKGGEYNSKIQGEICQSFFFKHPPPSAQSGVNVCLILSLVLVPLIKWDMSFDERLLQALKFYGKKMTLLEKILNQSCSSARQTSGGWCAFTYSVGSKRIFKLVN